MPDLSDIEPLNPRKPPKIRVLKVMYSAWKDGRTTRFKLERQHDAVQPILAELLVCMKHGRPYVRLRCPSCSASAAAGKISPDVKKRRSEAGARARWARRRGQP